LELLGVEASKTPSTAVEYDEYRHAICGEVVGTIDSSVEV